METYREKMYTSIGKNGLNHKDTIAISQELDEEIVKEMLKDPVVKCNYLERIIEAREAKIKRLEEKIRNLRKNFNINQVELASKLGVTKQCVSNWENDNILPSIEMLIKLAKFFSVTTDYLLDLNSDKTIDVSGLTDIQITHIKLIVQDLKTKQE